MLLRILKAWVPVAMMCIAIFLLSADSKSGRHSDMVLGWLLALVGHNTPHLRHLLDFPFRKFAHVFVYFWLGALSYRGFAMGSIGFRWPAAVRSLIFCMVYASTDEYHQRFVATRGPSVHDVFIDAGGALLALVLIWLWLHGRGQKAARVRQDDRPPQGAQPVAL